MSHAEKVLKALAHKAFDDFYISLQDDAYLRDFFIYTDMQVLKQKQIDNFLSSIQMETRDAHTRFIKLGQLHYKMGLPYSRYINSFYLLEKSMVRNLSNKENKNLLDKIQHFIDEAINGSAIGYLNEMIRYDLVIIQKLLEESIAQKFVNEHLFWIERVCFDIKNYRKTPSVELDTTKCILGRWLKTCEKENLLGKEELDRLHAMHSKIHSITQSVYDALAKKEYHSLLIDYSFLVRHSQHINYELHQVVTQKDLLEKSHTDSLTKLPNRTSLEAKTETIKLDKHSNFAIAMLDLDFFKDINDSYGHLCGDYILQEIGAILQKSLRKSDHVFRYGGEEFLLLLNDTDADEVLERLERLRESIKNRVFCYKNSDISITVSMGITHYQHKKHKNIQDIISQADTALYKAKKSGRNRIKIS